MKIHIIYFSDDKSYDLRTSSESRWLVRIGDGLDPSTFGAIGHEPKISTLYSTFEWSNAYSAIWVATRILPSHYFGQEGFLLHKILSYSIMSPLIKIIHINKTSNTTNELLGGKYA